MGSYLNGSRELGVVAVDKDLQEQQQVLDDHRVEGLQSPRPDASKSAQLEHSLAGS